MLKEAYKTNEIAGALGKSERFVRMLADQEKWPCIVLNKRGDKRFRLQDLPSHRQKELTSKFEIDSKLLPVLAPEAALAAAQRTTGYNPLISASPDPDQEPAGTWTEETSVDLQVVRDPRVAKWVAIIQEATTPPVGWKKRAWVEEVARRRQTSATYVYSRMAIYEKQGINGLVHRKSNRNQPKAWTPEAVDWWIGLCIKKEHRKLSKDGKRGALYPLLQNEARLRGWKIGSYKSALWWLKKRNNPQLIAFQHGGSRALDNSLPPILRTYADLAPFEIIVGDQHKFDFWVIDDETGEVFRPEGYFWQDLRTRCFYGAALDRKYDSYLMGLALRMGINVFGAFKTIYTDHGKPEESKYIMSIVRDMHGINLHVEKTVENLDLEYEADPELQNPLAMIDLHRRAIVRNAKAKMIEGTFNVLENILRNVFKVPGYVKKLGGSQEQNEVDEKEIRSLAESGGLLTYQQFFLTVLKALDWYNREKAHRGVLREWSWKRKPKSATPMDCLKSCYAQGWRKTEISQEVVDVIFLARERERIVDRGRVKFRNELYEHEKLIGLNGRQVELRFDPLDPEWILVFQAGNFVCRAGLVEYSSMKNHELAQAKMAEKSRRRKGFILEYHQLTSAIPDFRTAPRAEPNGAEPVNHSALRSKAPLLEKAAAALTQGQADRIERQKAENELSRKRSEEELAAEVAKLETAEKHPRPRLKVLPRRPEYFLTDLDRHRWIVKHEIAGGPLSQEDEAFKLEYESHLTEEQREYLETVRQVSSNM